MSMSFKVKCKPLTIRFYPIQNKMTPADNLTNTFVNYSNPDGFPFNQILAKPIIANEIWLTLSPSDGQTSSYLELRGCDLEGKQIHSFIEN